MIVKGQIKVQKVSTCLYQIYERIQIYIFSFFSPLALLPPSFLCVVLKEMIKKYQRKAFDINTVLIPFNFMLEKEAH